MGDTVKGVATGLLGLLGIGQVYDPLGDLRAELNSKIQEFNSMTSEYAYRANCQNAENSNLLLQLRTADLTLVKQSLASNNQMLWDSLETENLFIMFLYALIFIIILYLLVNT